MRACYRVIPTLVEQSTWGGTYIARAKGIDRLSVLSDKKLGQSYELYEHTMLSTDLAFTSAFMLGSPENPQAAALYGEANTVPINTLISADPEAFLGRKALKLGAKMWVLVKLTQAMGNSFQLHVRPDAKQNTWDTKPESWYYLAPGLATIGVRPGIDWEQYRQSCEMIDATSRGLSAACRQATISVDDARLEIRKVIDAQDIYSYVNTVVVQAGHTIDLSSGGVHHSWEESPEYPEGNIVYEVQKNAYDPDSTIRSFDKGKILNDGSIRELQIDDYFTFIDRSEVANTPATHMRTSKDVYSDTTHTVSQVFDSDFYQMEVLKLSGMATSDHTDTVIDESFHHLYAHEQPFILSHEAETYEVPSGWSVLVPAVTGTYTLTGQGTVFKTFV